MFHWLLWGGRKMLELPQFENCCCCFCFIDFLRKCFSAPENKRKKSLGSFFFLIRREQKHGFFFITNQGSFQQCSVHLKLGVLGWHTRPWCPLWLPCFWMKICRTAPVWSLAPSSSNTGRWGTRALSAGPQRLRYSSCASRGEAPHTLPPPPTTKPPLLLLHFHS